MGDAPRIAYTMREGATPEDERAALAAAYAFLLQNHEECKKGGPTTAPDDAMKGSVHDRARNIIPERP